MDCIVPNSLFLYLHNAGLSQREISKLVSVYIFHLNGLDFVLFVFYGLDDYYNR